MSGTDLAGGAKEPAEAARGWLWGFRVIVYGAEDGVLNLCNLLTGQRPPLPGCSCGSLQNSLGRLLLSPSLLCLRLKLCNLQGRGWDVKRCSQMQGWHKFKFQVSKVKHCPTIWKTQCDPWQW